MEAKPIVPGAKDIGMNGMPYIIIFNNRGEAHQENITLSNFSATKYPDGLRSAIKKVVDESAEEWYLFEGVKYNLEQIVKHFAPDRSQKKEWLRYAFQCIHPQVGVVIHRPFIDVKDDRLFFLDSIEYIYAEPTNPVQNFIVDHLKIGTVDMEYIKRGWELLDAHPKQMAIYLMIPAQVVVNILMTPVMDFSLTLDLVSPKDTGKSFAVRLSLHHWFGILDFFKGDVLNSSFRNNTFSAATNLPIYVQEAKLSTSIRRLMKSTGYTGRGTKDQALPLHLSIASFILSENSREKDQDADEQASIEKRFPTVFLDKRDVVSPKERLMGEKCKNELPTNPGGLIYEVFRKYTTQELKEKFWEIQESSNDIRETLLKYGSWLTGVPYVHEYNFGVEPEENWIELLYEWAKGVFNGRVEYDDNGFPIKRVYKGRAIDNDLRIDLDGNGIVESITLDSVMWKIFLSEHKGFQFQKWTEFHERYPQFTKIDTFSIGGVKVRSLKIVCDREFYHYIDPTLRRNLSRNLSFSLYQKNFLSYFWEFLDMNGTQNDGNFCNLVKKLRDSIIPERVVY